MTLKEKINADFITAMKARDEKKKSALSMLKAKITEAEKANGNRELTDDEAMKVVLSSVKQRRQSIEEFTKGGRMDLVEKEQEELKAVEIYLPSQLSESEIREEVGKILAGLPKDNVNKLVGVTTGTMNKNFPGQFDNKLLQTIIKEILHNYVFE